MDGNVTRTVHFMDRFPYRTYTDKHRLCNFANVVRVKVMIHTADSKSGQKKVQ